MKIVLTLAIALAAAAMVSCKCCNGSCEAPTQPAAQTAPAEAAGTNAKTAPTIADLAGTYHGVIPAADKAGFDVTITISADGSTHFVDKVVGEETVINDFVGQATLTTGSPQLTIRGEETYHFNLVDGNLLMVSPDGAEPELKESYILKKK